MGCLTRIGCAVILVAGGATGYWLYGDRLPSVLSRAVSGAADRLTDVMRRTSERFDSRSGARIAAEETARRDRMRIDSDHSLGWVTVGPELITGSSTVASVERTLEPLRSSKGPDYVSLTASETGDLLAPLMRQLPPSAPGAQFAFSGDALMLRTAVSLADFAGSGAIAGALGGVLGGIDTLFVAGPIELVRPGLAQFRVRELRLGGIDLPTRLIPPLIRMLRQEGERRLRDDYSRERRERNGMGTGMKPGTNGGPDPTGLTDDGLPISLPSSVSNVRIVNGRLTLYRATSAMAPASTRRNP